MEAADLVRKVSFLVVPESIMPLLRQGLSAKCQRTSALSAFLIVRGGNPAGDIDRVLSSAIRRALNSREVVTVELGLDTLEEIMSFPPTRGVIEALVYVLPELWSLSRGGKSVFIRYRARELLESISGRLQGILPGEPRGLQVIGWHFPYGRGRPETCRGFQGIGAVFSSTEFL